MESPETMSMRRARGAISTLLLLGASALAACGGAPDPGIVEEPDPVFPYPLDDVLRLNHVQAKSSHNSYHVETPGSDVGDWRYSHAPLDVQLDQQGVRHVELDLRYNWSLEYFEVYHLKLVDETTTCRKFTDCLRALKGWSDAHRAHHAFVVQLELLDVLPDDPEAYWDALHEEIRSVWPEKRIFTPDALKGDHATVGEAVAAEGWPTLGALRGHVIFALDNGGELRDSYSRGLTSLEGRILFPNSAPGQAIAAYAVRNDPVGDAASIAEALAANMLVRTRADADPGLVIETNGPAQREAALATGAQFVSTDFPVKVDATDYWLEIPGGTPSRCNPVTAPPECTSKALEDPSFVGP